MTEPYKRARREYDQSLRDRGDITLWTSRDAIDAWTPPLTGKRGAQRVYSDIAIETALSLRLFFRWWCCRSGLDNLYT